MRLKNAIHASTYIRRYPMPTLYIADAERDADMKNLSRKEAAKVLEGMKVKIEIPKAAVTQWKRNTALDMAIEALKYSGIPNSSDTISRQAAIDAADRTDYYGLAVEDVKKVTDEVIKELKKLPSAQPLTAYVISDEDGNIKCSNCGSPDCWGNYCMNCGAKMGR